MRSIHAPSREVISRVARGVEPTITVKEAAERMHWCKETMLVAIREGYHVRDGIRVHLRVIKSARHIHIPVCEFDRFVQDIAWVRTHGVAPREHSFSAMASIGGAL